MDGDSNLNAIPDSLLSAFAKVVQERREQLGFSQEVVANKADLHRTYISDIERGTRNLSLKTLCRLAMALEVQPSMLVRWAEMRVDPPMVGAPLDSEVLDLYNHAPCGYHSLDENGNIVRINDTELNWLGYTREELIGKNFKELVAEPYRRVVDENLDKIKQGGTIAGTEVRLVCKNGTRLPVLCGDSAMTDGEGRFVMTRGTVFAIPSGRLSSSQGPYSSFAP